MRCCAFGCKNLGTHVFPKLPDLRKQWETALNKQGFCASKYSRICSAHFTPDDYVKESHYSGLKLERRILKKGAVPSVFLYKKPTAGKRNKLAKYDITQLDTLSETRESFIEIDHKIEASTPPRKCDSIIDEISNFRTIGTQKSYAFYTIELFRGDDKGIQFYTGLDSFQKFMFILCTLNPRGRSTPYRWDQVANISIEDQFFVTLMKLRRNTEDYELGRFFDIDESSVHNIFVKWINFMHQIWSVQYKWSNEKLINVSKFTENPSTKVNNFKQITLQSPSEIKQIVQSSCKNHCKVNLSVVKIEVEVPPSDTLADSSEQYVSDTETIKNFQQVSENPTLINYQLSNLVHQSQIPNDMNYKILQKPVKSEYVSLMPKINFVCQTLCKFLESSVTKNLDV